MMLLPRMERGLLIVVCSTSMLEKIQYDLHVKVDGSVQVTIEANS